MFMFPPIAITRYDRTLAGLLATAREDDQTSNVKTATVRPSARRQGLTPLKSSSPDHASHKVLPRTTASRLLGRRRVKSSPAIARANKRFGRCATTNLPVFLSSSHQRSEKTETFVFVIKRPYGQKISKADLLRKISKVKRQLPRQ